MSNDKTGGPAFPLHDERNYLHDGMTLWDWYAGQALSGIMSNTDIMCRMSDVAVKLGTQPDSVISGIAAEAADAMIAERKKRGIA